jgi:hypothetical protein
MLFLRELVLSFKWLTSMQVFSHFQVSKGVKQVSRDTKCNIIITKINKWLKIYI